MTMQNRSAYGKMVNHFFHRILELNPGMGYKEAHNNAINRAALDGYRPSGKCNVVQADSAGGTEMICVQELDSDSKLRITEIVRDFYQSPQAQSLTLSERKALLQDVVRRLKEEANFYEEIVKACRPLE